MIKKLQDALKTDAGYRIGWVANIAMAFNDAHRIYQKHTGRRCSSRKDLWIVSNAASNYFIDLLSNNMKAGKGDGAYKLTSSIISYLAKSEKEFLASKKPRNKNTIKLVKIPKGKLEETKVIKSKIKR